MSEEKPQKTPNWGLGVALGMSIGVSLSVALDNWAFLAIGAGLMVAFAYAFAQPGEDEPEEDAR